MKAVLVLGALLGFSLVAQARKHLPVGEASKVGHLEELNIKPQVFAEGMSLLSTGQKVWRKEIRKPGASYLRLHFKDFNLRAGDELILRSESGRVIERLTLQGPKSRRSFWGLSAFGEAVELELRYNGEYEVPPFEVDKVDVGDINLVHNGFEFNFDIRPMSLCGAGDFKDVACVKTNQGKWKNVLASVGVMTAGGNASGSLFCSGSNVSPNNYVLTNAHCIDTQAKCEDAEFVFNYYREGCGVNGSTSEWVSFRCEEMVSMSPFGDCDPSANALDYSLHKVAGDPAAKFGYAQVATDKDKVKSGDGIYIIQHPRGRPHEITEGAGSMVEVDGHTLRYYDTLDTEPGSSGSPVYRGSDHKLIGLHHCGGCKDAGVGNRGSLMSDIYPKIKEYVCKEGVAINFSTPEPAREVEGNGNGVIEPGEIWEFLPTIKNSSCDKNADQITGSFVVSSGVEGIELLNSEVEFESVAPGKTGRAKTSIHFRVSSDFPCGNSFSIDALDLRVRNQMKFLSTEKYFTGQVGEEVFENALVEDFSKGLPANWSVIDGGSGEGPASTWTSANPGNRELSLTPPFFIADSDQHGKGNAMDEQLISRNVDLSDYGKVELQFKHEYKKYSSELADVDVRSSATQGRWVNVSRFTGTSTSGVVKVDITAHAAHQDDVQVRFHYHNGTYTWWWAVDDIYIIGSKGFVCK